MGGPVNMVDPNDPDGRSYAVPEDQIEIAHAKGWKPETAEQGSARAAAAGVAERTSGVAPTLEALKLGVARTVSGGLTDVLSDNNERRHARELREHHGIATGAGEVLGAFTGVGAAGLASKAGAAVTGAAKGAGAVARIGAAVAGGGLEGGIQGFGSGVSELALSDDPVTWERAASVISSHTLFGAGAGGAAGGLFGAAEVGLGKAKAALDDVARAHAARANLPEDLAAMARSPDAAKQLRLARGVEEESIAASHKAETEGLEAGRVTERQSIADEIGAHRAATKESKIWLATEGAEARAVRETRKISLDADKLLDKTLRNPKALATEPKRALAALQQEEHALEQLAQHGETLRPSFGADTSGAREAALDAIPGALERNRALQQRITDVATPLPKVPKTSPRLEAIDAARDALSTPAAKSLPEQMLGSSVFGGVTGLVAALPIPGSSFVAPWLGAKASKFITERVFGGLTKGMGAQAERASKAIGAFVNVAGKASRSAPVVASKVLANVAFAPSRDKPKRGEEPKATAKDLPRLYAKRSEEIRSQMTADPVTGKSVMRPEARAELGRRLDPVRVISPIGADRIETAQARKLEYIDSQRPRKPDLAGMQVGPDKWQPSDMEMRRWARVVAAAEDPHGIVERLADGSITPEDAETMKAVYPELHADISRQIVEKLPQLRSTLPYQRRLALSIFSGVPVDPAMDPRVLAELQATFADEPGSEGGTQAPKPQPQFGSVKAEKPTPAQERAT